jgi:short-subunit dehydrogenase
VIRRYGPWAVVAGASEGLGAAFAERLAGEGLSLVLLARRAAVLDALAARLERSHGVSVRTLAIDLASPSLAAEVGGAVAGLDVGLLVYNAAAPAIGAFLDEAVGAHLRSVDVNVRGPVVLAHLLGTSMAERGRGGIILVSSVAALSGSPLLATYAATKSFQVVLAEGLWAELRARGVDVLAVCAGATRTPGFERSRPRLRPRTMEPSAVVDDALAALGRRPVTVAGWLNRAAALALGRLLPRTVAVGIMARTARRLYGP